MVKATKKDVKIVIKGKDEASKAFKSAEGSVNRFRKSINEVSSKGGLGKLNTSIEDLTKLTKVVATVEVAFRGIEVGAKGFPGGMKFLRGDIAGASAALAEFSQEAKSIPFAGASFSLGNLIGQFFLAIRPTLMRSPKGPHGSKIRSSGRPPRSTRSSCWPRRSSPCAGVSRPTCGVWV